MMAAKPAADNLFCRNRGLTEVNIPDEYLPGRREACGSMKHSKAILGNKDNRIAD